MRPLGTEFLGSQLGVDLSARTIMPLIMLGLGITAAESLVRSHPIARQGNLGRSIMYWIIPGLLVTSLATWLVTVTDIGLWTAGLLFSSILIPLALAAEYAAVDKDHESRTILQWGQIVLIHLLAFILFSRIFDARARSLLSGTAVIIIASLLAARLYWPIVGDPSEALIYGATAGVLLGFYVVVGLIQQYLYGRFSRQAVIEYAGVGVIAAIAVLIAA